LTNQYKSESFKTLFATPYGNQGLLKESTMKKEAGNWMDFRARFGLLPEDEIDLHYGPRDVPRGSYYDLMAQNRQIVLAALQRAFERQRPYVMFTHGWSTSRRGKTTARSVVREVMRSKEATPYIHRGGCIQHFSVFVAKIRSRKSATTNLEPSRPSFIAQADNARDGPA
jgi:hypothetical protein